MTSPADRILRDQVAALLFARRREDTPGADGIDLAITCMRDADTFLVGRDEYHKLMAAKPAMQPRGMENVFGHLRETWKEGDDDLAG